MLQLVPVRVLRAALRRPSLSSQRAKAPNAVGSAPTQPVASVLAKLLSLSRVVCFVLAMPDGTAAAVTSRYMKKRSATIRCYALL